MVLTEALVRAQLVLVLEKPACDCWRRRQRNGCRTSVRPSCWCDAYTKCVLEKVKTHTRIHTYTYSHTHTRTHTHTATHTYTDRHMGDEAMVVEKSVRPSCCDNASAHTDTQTHAHMHTGTHQHMHTHT